VGVRPVIDRPVRPPGERVEHVQPTLIAGRDELDQRVQDRERLAVRSAQLRLPDGVAKRFDRLLVSDLRAEREVGSCFSQPTRGQQRPSNEAVQPAPPRTADALIDRLLD
jgi:hypothetical protein